MGADVTLRAICHWEKIYWQRQHHQNESLTHIVQWKMSLSLDYRVEL